MLENELSIFAEPEYAKFTLKLTPGLASDSVLGIRVPKLRLFAKSFMKDSRLDSFLQDLPHKYYEENLLHSILLLNYKDFEKCLFYVEKFLPYVDNWAVCDTLRPKSFEKHKADVLPHVLGWIGSAETYTCRFGIDILMTYFLETDFSPDFPAIVASVNSNEYYVKMMVAWYFATALAFRYDDVIGYIEQHKLPKWTHNKAIQKSIESYRVTDEHKEYLKSLRV